MNKLLIERIALVTGGLAIGSGATYLLTSRRLEAKYRALAEEEIAKTKSFLNIQAKGESPESYLANYQETLGRMGYGGTIVDDDNVADTIARGRARMEKMLAEGTVSEQDLIDAAREEEERQKGNDIDADDEELVPATPEELAEANDSVTLVLPPQEAQVVTNVFVEADRTPEGVVPLPEPLMDEPYLISYDMFFEDEPPTQDFSRITVTYYEGDKVLTDDQEQPIDDVVRAVGSEFQYLFGQHSNDENMVYIVNPIQQVKYEIVRDPLKYSVVVLGLND